MSFEVSLENQIALDKETLETGKALARLMGSSDFRKVILDGYLKNRAVALVYERASSTEPDDHVSRQIDSVAHFKSYLDKLLEDATIAEKLIAENSDLLFQSRNEEV